VAARTAEVAGASREPALNLDADKPSRTYKNLRLQYPKKNGETQGKYRLRLTMVMRKQAPPAQGSSRKVFLKDAGELDKMPAQKAAVPWAATRKK